MTDARDSVIQFGFRNYEPVDITNVYVDSNWHVTNYYAIRLKNYVNNKKFGVIKVSYEIKLKFANIVDMPLTYIYLKRCLKDIFAIIKNNKFTNIYNNHLRVVITAPSLRENINLPFRTFDDIDVEKTLDEIEKVSQSNSGLFYDDLLTFHFISKQF